MDIFRSGIELKTFSIILVLLQITIERDFLQDGVVIEMRTSGEVVGTMEVVTAEMILKDDLNIVTDATWRVASSKMERPTRRFIRMGEQELLQGKKSQRDRVSSQST